ncbi:heme lyase CcmF/NrfE family subunit [Wenzhouxiangella sp. XN79A]|uniref:heme lyase CcmF/NrfE family subunit n=1 Tax=Wenzhouxiangella sp. XN79A TaxID=2724193 RepID=UPI0023F6A473|nr:heme lyase CcmF/NrfE family subunit [Wenzhouxiangella sp. XN79A]
MSGLPHGLLGELGQVAMITSLAIAFLLATLPLIGAWRNDSKLMALAPSLTLGLFVFVTLAFGILVTAFVINDFTIAYVATNSNLLLPVYYRVTAVWGGHEGSLLLWVMMLAGWMIAVVMFSRSLSRPFLARVLAVMSWIVIGFLLFTILTSNPFQRLLPTPPDGADLNPLLQDPGMIFHPPLLYMGYVGFAVAFAFAIAGLLGGRVERDWVRWMRPWTLAAWSFLTGGIALGSWWAYYELGWGGWWFWDPVENASFMPWLVGTALIHSQLVTEKRNAFPAWTVLLAIAAFSLSLLGTFLVRSGVLTSVHAFANDPERGLFILAFLGIVTGGALLLFLLRAPKLAHGEGFDWFSRESLLLSNNLLLVVSAAMVLIGTLYPILVDFMGWGQVSVGPPYFGAMFILLMTPLVLLLPFGPMSRWKQDRWARAARPLLIPAVVAVVAGTVLAWLLDAFTLRAVTGWIGGLWLIFGALAFVARALKSSSGFLRGHWGMTAAHLGVGVFVIGVAMVESATSERDFAFTPGQTIETAGLAFRLDEVVTVKGPNWAAEEARFTVLKNGEPVTTMAPQKRRYYRSGQVMTQVALKPGPFRDLYIAMGQPLDNGAWSIRVHVKPFIRWIWGGAVLMLIGGLLAATDPRYRRLAAHAANKAERERLQGEVAPA